MTYNLVVGLWRFMWVLAVAGMPLLLAAGLGWLILWKKHKRAGEYWYAEDDWWGAWLAGLGALLLSCAIVFGMISGLVYVLTFERVSWYMRAVTVERCENDLPPHVRIIAEYDDPDSLPAATQTAWQEHVDACATAQEHRDYRAAYGQWLRELKNKTQSHSYLFFKHAMRSQTLESFEPTPLSKPTPWQPWSRQARVLTENDPILQLGAAIAKCDPDAAVGVLREHAPDQADMTLDERAYFVMARETVKTVIQLRQSGFDGEYSCTDDIGQSSGSRPSSQ